MSFPQMRRFLIIAVAALVIATWTGVLMRFGMVYGMPDWAQNFGAVRHAHSHLMYFGWVTLAIMAMIWAELPKLTGRPLPRGVAAQMTLTAAMALLSFPAFWINGYGLTTVGSVRLPLGSMVATFNGLTWLLFMALYVRATRGLAVRPLSVQLWDWALVLLALASVGAAGLVGTVMADSSEPLLQQIFLHQFLDLFAVGWFNLALLGLLWAWLPAGMPSHWLPTFSLALLLTPTFLLGVSPALLPPALFWVAAIANAGAALLLGVHGVQLWRRRRELPALTWLALSGLAGVLVVASLLLWPDLWRQLAGGQTRVFYLHMFLLMWISTALVGQIYCRVAPASGLIRRWVKPLWASGVLVMVAGLLGLGISPWLGTPMLWWLHVTAWGSLAVALGATMLPVVLLAPASTRSLPLPTTASLQ
ncbi:MAG: hypothetical protein R6W76_04430 [Caldilinea sp.]